MPIELTDSLFEEKGTSRLKRKTKLSNLITRPQLSIFDFLDLIEPLKFFYEDIDPSLRNELFESAEIQLKYSGYIERESIVADKLLRLENLPIGGWIKYSEIESLSTEARQKLNSIKPSTIGQAARIPGVSPNDINVLLVLLGR